MLNELIRSAVHFEMPKKPDGVSKREYVAQYRAALIDAQDWLFSSPESLGADDFPTKHYFCEGAYIRQLFVPKGVFLIGRTHKTKHLNIVMSGAVNIITEGAIKLVEAPAIIESEPHLKRAGYVLRDMLWATVHPTAETNVEKVEEELFYTYEEEKRFIADELKNIKQHKQDNMDYEKVLLEHGIKEDEVQKVVKGTDDRISILPSCFEIKPSPINGVGIFSKEEIQNKKFIARTKEGKQTNIGRYTNHSITPNGKMEQQGESIILNIGKVKKGEEITINYRKALKIAKEMGQL